MNKKRSSQVIVKILFLIFVGILIAYGVSKEKTKPRVGLKETVEQAMVGTKGTYAVAIKNFKTGETYYRNEHKIFKSGSLYKQWIMATAFAQIQNKKLEEDEILSEKISVLNEKFNINPQDAELTEGVITLSVKDAISQMITISHNYAALILTERIRLSSASSFLKNNSFTESQAGVNGEYPTTTAFDTELFFEKLYKGELVNKKYSERMLEILKKQTLNDKLPKYLPKNVIVAHKTGEIDFLSHDGGIVFTPQGDYIIVVLSKSDMPSAAEDRIAKVSQAVYEFFLKSAKNNL